MIKCVGICRLNKRSEEEKSDESMISVLNIIFESVLFIFDFVLFNIIYFLFRTILLQLQVIIFQEQIFERLSLGSKERIIGVDSCQKYEDHIQKYLVQGFMSRI